MGIVFHALVAFVSLVLGLGEALLHGHRVFWAYVDIYLSYVLASRTHTMVLLLGLLLLTMWVVS